MGIRRNARRIAVRVLYIVDVLGVTSKQAWEIIGLNNGSKDTIRFAETLVDGTLKNINFINNIILKYTKNWEIKRIACVDRTIIRMGLYEIYFEDSIPRNASINEAVELAKYYSTGKSHKFVNGILDSGSSKIAVKNNNVKNDG